MQALLVSSDVEAARILQGCLSSFGTALEVYSDVVEALCSARQRRFDVNFVDPEGVTRAAPLLPVLREIASHRKQMIVSLLRPDARQPEVHSFGADSVLWKPLNAGATMRFLRAAHGLIYTEHLRYLRHHLESSVMVGFGIEEIPATLANLSAGGVCLLWRRTRTPFGPLRIRLMLPGEKLPITLDGEVAWTAPSAHVGVRFTHLTDLARIQLERWLVGQTRAQRSRDELGTGALGRGVRSPL